MCGRFQSSDRAFTLTLRSPYVVISRVVACYCVHMKKSDRWVAVVVPMERQLMLFRWSANSSHLREEKPEPQKYGSQTSSGGGSGARTRAFRTMLRGRSPCLLLTRPCFVLYWMDTDAFLRAPLRKLSTLRGSQNSNVDEAPPSDPGIGLPFNFHHLVHVDYNSDTGLAVR